MKTTTIRERERLREEQQAERERERERERSKWFSMFSVSRPATLSILTTLWPTHVLSLPREERCFLGFGESVRPLSLTWLH